MKKGTGRVKKKQRREKGSSHPGAQTEGNEKGVPKKRGEFREKRSDRNQKEAAKERELGKQRRFNARKAKRRKGVPCYNNVTGQNDRMRVLIIAFACT